MRLGGLCARVGDQRSSGGKTANRRHRLGRLVSVAILLALLGLATGFHTADAADAGWVDTDLLNLRSDPGTWAGILDQMPQGAPVDILAGPTEDGWYQVSYYGNVGWAYGGYLSINGAPGWSDWAGGGAGPERWIDINRSTQTVTLFEGDVVVASFWAALGYDQTDHGFYATANGTYYVYGKNKSLTWTDWGKVFITDWVAFDPERYNGFHSYSRDGNGNVIPGGDGATGGCVALDPWAADLLYDFADYGMRVEVHW